MVTQGHPTQDKGKLMKYSNHQLSINGARWIDLNTMISVNDLPDRLPDDVCIVACSFVNLLNCSIGARSKTFEPTYGTMLYHYLQEPIDDITAESIRISLIQAIGKWEPRVRLDYGKSQVTPEFALPGYRIHLAFTMLATGEDHEIDYYIKQGSSNG